MRKKYPPDKSLGEMKVNAYTMTLEGSRALQVIEVKKGKPFRRYTESYIFPSRIY